MLTNIGPARLVPKVFNKEYEGHEVQKGTHARLSSFVGAVAVSDLVKTTLGPKGMDKMLVSLGPNPSENNVIVTNDGATILKKLPVDNPAAKILVNISMTQDDEVGDGTTSVVVLAGSLLREAEKLVILNRIHPQIIINGWRKALKYATDALRISALDNKSDPKQFKEDLLNIARTTLSSKIVINELDFFANLCVEAVLRLKGSIDLDMIQIIKKQGGSMIDSFLDDGFILNKSFGLSQKTLYNNNPKILLANTGLDTDKIKIWGARVKVNSLTDVANIEQAEKQKMKLKIDKILKFEPDIFINRQLIYDYPEELFRDHNIGSIEHADFEGIERLARVLNGEIMSTFNFINKEDRDLKLGTCKKVEEILIGEDKVIKFSGVPKGEACTIVLRGSSSHILDEIERSIHDALCILTQTIHESKIVFGGGCSEMLMATAIEKQSKNIGGKESIAMLSFSNALKSIPIILSDNAGFDSSELLANLIKAHNNNKHYYGINMKLGKIGNMKNLGVIESYKSKLQSLISAHEAAEMILRVDDIIKCAPRPRDRGH